MRAHPSRHRIVQASMGLAAVVLCSQAFAQSITVRMLNGKSGKPVHDKSIHVEFEGSSAKFDLSFDKKGIGHVDIPAGATAVSLVAPTKGKDSNEPAYTVCGPFGQFIPVKDILEHGYVPQDPCNFDLHLTAAPGELLYLIEPLPWYTPALR